MPDGELAAYRQLETWPNRIQLASTIPRELVIDRTYQFEAAKFAENQIPTLLLLGGDSPPIFRRAIDLLEDTLPNSQTIILPNQQHIAMDTNPDLFVKEVLNFLGTSQRNT
jgi:pimeloyl-ACP methyl ester carboxylesterase